jgi:hypothetical protein
MINHFRTWLLNRQPECFADSLWPVPIPDGFQPVSRSSAAERIDKILFGSSQDASLMDYRFFQYLRIIDGCHLRGHVRRWDSREAYFQESRSFQGGTLFIPSIVPASGLAVAEQAGTPADLLRRRFSVVCQPDRNVPITVFWDGDRTRPARLERTSDMSGTVDSLGLTLTATRPGSWFVDYRKRPEMPVSRIVSDVLELPSPVFLQLFGPIRETAPEYEEGFHTVTDTLTKFCMILFALAIRNETGKDAMTLAPKRFAESDAADLPANAEGTLYYGHHPAGSLRIGDVKKELTAVPSVRNRRQTFDLTVPSPGYIYLAWPTRFGLPAHQRIIVDGLLNSAWIVTYADDRDEQYTILRSQYKVRSEQPIHLEIL